MDIMNLEEHIKSLKKSGEPVRKDRVHEVIIALLTSGYSIPLHEEENVGNYIDRLVSLAEAIVMTNYSKD